MSGCRFGDALLRQAFWRFCLPAEAASCRSPQPWRAAGTLYSTAAEGQNASEGTVAVAGQDSSSAQELYASLEATLRDKKLPKKGFFRKLLSKCESPEDVQLAFKATELLRIERAKIGGQLTNFDLLTTNLLISACVRSGALEQGLVCLERNNPLGLNLSLPAAQQLLTAARLKEDIPLVLKVVNTMLANGLVPDRGSANRVLSCINRVRDRPLLLKTAEEFDKQGIQLPPFAHRSLVTAAADTGDLTAVQKWMKLLEPSGLTPYPTAQAMVALMEGDVEKAFQVLMAADVPDDSRRVSTVKYLVCGWPAKIKRCEQETGKRQVSLKELKERLKELVEKMRNTGLEIPLDVQSDFGKERPIGRGEEQGSVAAEGVAEQPVDGEEGQLEKAGHNTCCLFDGEILFLAMA